MGVKRSEVLHKVLGVSGKVVHTLHPVTVNTRREIVQDRLGGHTINRGPSQEDQELADSLNITETLKNARTSRAKSGL